MKYQLFLLLMILSACSHRQPSPSEVYVSTVPQINLNYSQTLTRIAFGSCANQDEPQPLWKDISLTRPELFLFTGDNVYASSPLQKPIAAQYKKLDAVPEYLELRSKIPFMATWDDHDFGQRDGGTSFQGKTDARRDFLNYWGYVKSSIPFDQDGVYHARTVGPKNKIVQVIMLDTRFNRSDLLERPGFEGQAKNYLPNNAGTVLGEPQWTWLEAQLKKPADVRFIVSSIQLIPELPEYEKWGNFPKERQRFFDLITKSKAKNIVLISGDRHIASISKMDLKGYGPLHEITASSLNRPNKYSDNDAHYVGPVYGAINFGFATIDWNRRIVKMEILGQNGLVANQVEIKLKK